MILNFLVIMKQLMIGIRDDTGKRFVFADADRTNSLKAVLRYLFYDFHAIMNNELTFSFQPWFFDNMNI